MAVTRDAQATRERLIGAARNAFSQHGFERTTVREIAGEAGVNPALINRYFGGKEQLFDLLGRRELARFLDVVTDAFTASDDPTDALAGGLHAAATYLADHAAVRYILEHEPEVAVPVRATVPPGRQPASIARRRAAAGRPSKVPGRTAAAASRAQATKRRYRAPYPGTCIAFQRNISS